ncbi:TPA: 50S ribosomal protein L4 [Candidatus Woesearchaeota archaeon]|nr:50S ribosomal protein L4 [Candidatus Woesearchaeota archaeon]
MKVKVLTPTNTEKGSVELPKVFSEPVREDIIKRAVEVVQANRRQPYGADPRAGKKCSAELSRRRRKYRGSYGHGISRVPRKILSRSGNRMNWVGAFAPGTVGGRRAHAPKALKIWAKKINVKERRKAIRSAIAATVVRDFVEKRGHKMPASYPFALSSDFESLDKTKDVMKALLALGFKAELSRADDHTFRSGRARLRGRKYRKKKGPLVVVSDECPLLLSAENIAGVDVVKVSMLNAELLAPGCVPGRLTLFTEAAIGRLAKDALFTDTVVVEKKEKVAKDMPKKARDKDARAKRRETKKTRSQSRKAKKEAEAAAAAEADESSSEDMDSSADASGTAVAE